MECLGPRLHCHTVDPPAQRWRAHRHLVRGRSAMVRDPRPRSLVVIPGVGDACEHGSMRQATGDRPTTLGPLTHGLGDQGVAPPRQTANRPDPDSPRVLCRCAAVADALSSARGSATPSSTVFARGPKGRRPVMSLAFVSPSSDFVAAAGQQLLVTVLGAWVRMVGRGPCSLCNGRPLGLPAM